MKLMLLFSLIVYQLKSSLRNGRGCKCISIQAIILETQRNPPNFFSVTSKKVSYHLSYLAGLNLIQEKMTGGNVYYYRTHYAKEVLNWLEKIPLNKQ
jgi:hypothetical protein